jgi:hypothetical protein
MNSRRWPHLPHYQEHQNEKAYADCYQRKPAKPLRLRLLAIPDVDDIERVGKPTSLALDGR